MDPDPKPTSPDKHKKEVSPLKPEISPSFKEGKLVRDHKTGKIGKLTLVDKDDKGDVTAVKIHWEGEEKPSRRKRTSQSLDVVPIDIKKGKYYCSTEGQIGKECIVWAGIHVGATGIVVRSSGNRCTLKRESGEEITVDQNHIRYKKSETTIGSQSIDPPCPTSHGQFEDAGDDVEPSCVQQFHAFQCPRNMFRRTLEAYECDKGVELVIKRTPNWEGFHAFETACGPQRASLIGECESEVATSEPDILMLQCSTYAQCQMYEIEALTEALNPRARVTSSITFACARGFSKASTQSTKRRRAVSKKVGCPFTLKCSLYEDRPNSVVFEELGTHKFHIPGTEEDAKVLKPHSAINRLLEHYLKEGHSQQRIVRLIDNKVNIWCTRQKVHPSWTWRGRRMRITEADVSAVRKKLARGTQVTSNDVIATEAILKQWGDEVVIKYQPQEVVDGVVASDLVVVICTPYQQEMMKAFGDRLVFMDFTNGVVKYNFPFGAMTVKDDQGRGFPVASMLSTSESEATITTFVNTILNKTNIRPAFMIDKSAAEIAALNSLGLQWHLCLFHVLQDWERTLKKGNGVQGKENRLQILREMRALAKSQTLNLFKFNEQQFEETLQTYPTISSYYAQYWKPISQHWAAYGRQSIADLCSDTNNLQEVQFRMFKYNFCMKRKMTRVEQVISLYTTEFVPHFINQREKFVKGFKAHSRGGIQKKYEYEVDYLVQTKGAIQILEGSIGLCHVISMSQEDKLYVVVVGDMSCECEANSFDICKHVEAASKVCPYTIEMRKVATKCVLRESLIREVDAAKGIYKCLALASTMSDKGTEKDFTIVLPDLWCSCLDFGHHKDCCHLQACKEHKEISQEWRTWIKDQLPVDAIDAMDPLASTKALRIQRDVLSAPQCKMLKVDALQEIEAMKKSSSR